jgi:dihydrofolate synthase/folylpolyglutamate synthase
MKFLDLTSTLSNPEKSRDFNRFKNYSLTPFQECLERFGLDKRQNPELTRISVVGTNGKGSLAHYLCKLINPDQAVGLFTSPHLLSVLERIQVNCKNADSEILDNYLTSLSEEDIENLKGFSFFEVMTLLSMVYFQKKNINWEIYEAGLGGRLDSTKLTNPDYVAITKIGLDHTEILGGTEEAILLEKLGILGLNTKAIFALHPNKESLVAIYQKFSKENRTPIHFFHPTPGKTYLENYYEMAKFILTKINILPSIPASFDTVPKPSARLEAIRSNPPLVYDTAHNAQACLHTLSNLDILYPGLEWNCILGSLPDKDSDSIIQGLKGLPQVRNIFTLDFDPFKKLEGTKRIHSPKELSNHIQEFQENNLPSVILGSFRIYEWIQEWKS